MNLSKNNGTTGRDIVLVALYKFFKTEANLCDIDALEAAEAVIRLQAEGRLDEVLEIAREGKE